MYVPRERLESALLNAMQRQEHILLSGEPGTGKSWLYKKVISDSSDYSVLNVNLAVANRQGSVVQAISLAMADPTNATKVSYQESKSASVGIPGTSGELSHSGNYEYESPDEFLRVLQKLSKSAKNKKPVIIFDNLEQIFDNTKLMRELGSLIILVDDPVYAQWNTKLVVVGVPSNVRDYYARVDNLRTVSTRLKSVPEVKGFSQEEIFSLVARGFCNELKVEIKSIDLKKLQNMFFTLL